MPYKRKTTDAYEIQQYLFGQWETVTTEATHKEAKLRYKEYKLNQPEYPVRVHKHRVPIAK